MSDERSKQPPQPDDEKSKLPDQRDSTKQQRDRMDPDNKDVGEAEKNEEKQEQGAK